MNRFLGGLLALVCLVAPATVVGQSDEGDTGAAWRGGALGAYSGFTLALAGSLAPCNLVLEAERCSRVATGFGTVVGATSGAILSYDDPDALWGRVRGAGVGILAGAALGAALRLRFRQVDWRDVGAAAAVGAAVGTAPVGSAVGLGVGMAVGTVLWLVVPGPGLPEAAAMGVVGLAIGGLGVFGGRRRK
jgi:hypothetical protein